jgi:hypothetical protein
MVEFSGAVNAQVFASGERAERSARDLAQRLAEAGAPAQITVYLRDGSVGGRFVTACP